MPANITNAIVFVISSLAQLYLLVLLLRFWLPLLGADFHNPLAQAILKLTSPLVIPLRRVLPAVGRLDTATVLVAFVIQYVTILVLLLIVGHSAGFIAIAVTALVDLIVLSLYLFIFSIIIRVILSWVAPPGYNPAMSMIATLTDRVLQPFRRILPPLGGLDVSPVLAIILLMAVTIIVSGLKPLPF